VRFLIDAQLPPSLVRALNKTGHNAKHVSATGLLTATDAEIWRYARREKRAIVTKDQDFIAFRKTAKDEPAVVWLRMGNVTNAVLEQRLLTALPQAIAAIEGSEKLVEIR
jgi:predicted nuclease of predicted toxin-antitoxin system